MDYLKRFLCKNRVTVSIDPLVKILLKIKDVIPRIGMVAGRTEASISTSVKLQHIAGMKLQKAEIQSSKY